MHETKIGKYLYPVRAIAVAVAIGVSAGLVVALLLIRG
jgi:hypothetical protein